MSKKLQKKYIYCFSSVLESSHIREAGRLDYLALKLLVKILEGSRTHHGVEPDLYLKV